MGYIALIDEIITINFSAEIKSNDVVKIPNSLSAGSTFQYSLSFSN